jgi:hypothetical protein
VGSRRSRPALFIVLVSLWANAGTRASESPQSELPIRAALERYALEADRSISLELSARQDFPRILRTYSEEADRWVASQPGERTRRERVSIGLAMDLLAAAVNGSIQSYQAGRHLIEWACELLRKGPPTEFERVVHLTSLAILQGAGDYYTFGIDEGPIKRAGHFDHAIARYPDEDRLKLARVLSRYELRLITTERVEPADLVPAMRYRPPEGLAKRLAETRDLLTVLDGSRVKDEAVLRRGVLQLLVGDLARASLDLGVVSQSADPFVSYMANLMLGSMYNSAGQTEAAVARYAKASFIVPASSGRLALSAALLKQGHAQDAAEISAQALAGDRIEDPWRMYGLGLFHSLPEYLAAMRAELR